MKRQVKKIVHKGFCMLLAGIAVLTASVSLTACVDQHPDGQGRVREIPATAQRCALLPLLLLLHRFVTNWS